MNNFEYVSLFSGIGGMDIAFNEVGGMCVLAAEKDKFANKAYETLHGIKPKGDVKEIKNGELPEHDLLVGGFPCQAFSITGERTGMTYKCTECGAEQVVDYKQYIDNQTNCNSCNALTEPLNEQGTLFYEVVRVMAVKKPKVVLLENVKGLLSHDKGNTMNTIIQTLNKIGYTVDYEVLNSMYFNLPQSRERVFIVAVKDELIGQEDWIINKGIVGKTKENQMKSIKNIKTFNFNFPKQKTITKTLKDILQPVEEIEERFFLKEKYTEEFIKEYDEVVELPLACETKPIDVIGRVTVNGHDMLKRVYNKNYCSPTLTAASGGNTEPKVVVKVNGEYKVRKLTPLEYFRLQGFTDEQHDKLKEVGISNTQRYRQAGNAVSVNVIRHLTKPILQLMN